MTGALAAATAQEMEGFINRADAEKEEVREGRREGGKERRMQASCFQAINTQREKGGVSLCSPYAVLIQILPPSLPPLASCRSGGVGVGNVPSP